LLVFQGYTSNPAIPAKVYEYLRARRPILALLDYEGDTARLLVSEKVGTVLPIEDTDAILDGLEPFLEQVQGGTAAIMSPERASRFERANRAAELAALLDACTGTAAAPGSIPAGADKAGADDPGRLPMQR